MRVLLGLEAATASAEPNMQALQASIEEAEAEARRNPELMAAALSAARERLAQLGLQAMQPEERSDVARQAEVQRALNEAEEAREAADRLAEAAAEISRARLRAEVAAAEEAARAARLAETESRDRSALQPSVPSPSLTSSRAPNRGRGRGRSGRGGKGGRGDEEEVKTGPRLTMPTMEEDEDSIPPEWFCPLTHEIFQSPVFLPDGYTYEEASIRQWLTKQHTSPMTGEDLGPDVRVVPNRSMRDWITRLS